MFQVLNKLRKKVYRSKKEKEIDLYIKTNGLEILELPGHEITYKKISPAEFLCEAGGVPISLFIEKKVMTMYEQSKALDEVDEKKDEKKDELFHRKILDLTVFMINGKPFKTSMFNRNDAIALSSIIIFKSLKMFNKRMKIDHNQAVFYDMMAKRYSKTPIECMCVNTESYTDLDAFMLNGYILSKAVERENLENKKAEARARKNKMRGGR